MLKKDKVRMGIIVLVIVLSVAAVFPISGRVKLGLDLKGGAHVVLQAKLTEDISVDDDIIERLIATLRNRIDQYGIVEPMIQREGSDRVAIDLPGIEDPDEALELIGRTAMLEFRSVIGIGPESPPPVERKNYPNDAEYDEAVRRWTNLNEAVMSNIEAFEARANGSPDVLAARGDSGETYLLGEVYVSGQDLIDARVTYDELQKPAVSLRFNSNGASAFEAATGANIDKQIAIVLDNVVISAPVVRSRISGGEAQISGNFSSREAANLAVMLRAGALPVEVEMLENRSVGPTLGEDSIRSGVQSGLIGAVLVAFFMLIYYGVLGIAADIAMIVAMLLLLAIMIALRTTLTLPGIGGIVLTIGMAVDGNILIYERVREEFRSGKTILAALDSGFRKALVVILDSNVTTLIAAAVLFYFGTGPVRGFAVTLSFGVVTGMFGNIVVTRAILEILLRYRKNIAL
ncbi:MAG: protein translocase subunit SecD [Synergistaceae bacterium]|jgi:preprotein translocase subunit SecD|nr:protein translocase subunit SecD [Synergistaceae bacterium]